MGKPVGLLGRAIGAEKMGADHCYQRKKKEEFPGTMENMPPGNSFPQICVVSVKHSVEIIGY